MINVSLPGAHHNIKEALKWYTSGIAIYAPLNSPEYLQLDDATDTSTTYMLARRHVIELRLTHLDKEPGRQQSWASDEPTSHDLCLDAGDSFRAQVASPHQR